MTWVKLDDHFDQHPKLQAVGPLGVALWVAGLAYCNRNLTDGFIPWGTARSLLAWEYLGVAEEDGRRKRYRVSRSSGHVGDDVDAEHVIGLLIDADLWDEIDGGYLIHDYDKYQPLREEVERERQAAKGRMQSVRANNKRSSHDVPANVRRSSATPVPDPVPVPIKDDDDDSRARDSWAETYWRNFGHEATEAQVTELENAEANHPRECIAWILSEVGAGDLKWRNMRSVRMKLNDCATLGHGPRSPRYESKKATLKSSDGREFQSGLSDMIVPNTNLRIVEVE